MTHLIVPTLFMVLGLILGLYLLRCRHTFQWYYLQGGDYLRACESCGHMKKIVRTS